LPPAHTGGDNKKASVNSSYYRKKAGQSKVGSPASYFIVDFVFA